MAKWSIKTLLSLIAEIEDSENNARQLGLFEAARHLGFAKTEIVKDLSKLEARRAKVSASRTAIQGATVVRFPGVTASTTADAEAQTAKSGASA